MITNSSYTTVLQSFRYLMDDYGIQPFRLPSRRAVCPQPFAFSHGQRGGTRRPCPNCFPALIDCAEKYVAAKWQNGGDRYGKTEH